MRTGTRTVRVLSLMTSPPAMICGRCSRTDSRTFSSCRSQSRAPRENSSYHFASPSAPVSLPLSLMVFRCSAPCAACELLLGQQCRHVAQGLLGTVLVVAIFLHEALLHHGNLLPCVVIRTRGRGDQPQHVATLLEQILLDGLTHAGVAHQLELLASLEGHHGLAHDFLAKRQLARIGDLDLL